MCQEMKFVVCWKFCGSCCLASDFLRSRLSLSNKYDKKRFKTIFWPGSFFLTFQVLKKTLGLYAKNTNKGEKTNTQAIKNWKWTINLKRERNGKYKVIFAKKTKERMWCVKERKSIEEKKKISNHWTMQGNLCTREGGYTIHRRFLCRWPCKR